MNKNKMLGVFQVDNKHYQFDYYGVKKYEGVNQEDGMPIYMKKVLLKVNRCINSIPKPIQDEIEYSKTLKHPYLTNLLKVFQDDCHINLVSERGVLNLQNNINQIHSDQRIFSVILDLLIGLCFIRSKRYLHCNFVASNIQICESNIKIGGLDACFPEQTAIGKVRKVQKLNFKQMCPQILKQEQFSEKGLIWNFGVIVYQMIFKKLPFEGQRKQQVLSKMMAGVNFSSKIHPLFSIILIGCLRSNPLCRFSLNQLLRCILNSNNELSCQFEQILGKKIGAFQAAYTLPESEWMFQKFTIMMQIICELDFVRFLERFCFLVSKIQKTNDAPPILSLTQFVIKCRLYKLQRHQYWNRNKYCHKIEFDMGELIKNHSGTITNGQQYLMNNPDYKFFTLPQHSHKQITYIHYQHFLRQFIQKHSKQLYRLQASEIESQKYIIYSIDFAISLFLINEDVIQKGQEHKWNALDSDQINQLSQNALQPNIRAVYADVIGKAKRMGFISL